MTETQRLAHIAIISERLKDRMRAGVVPSKEI